MSLAVYSGFSTPGASSHTPENIALVIIDRYSHRVRYRDIERR
jgi:hypothetical protein